MTLCCVYDDRRILLGEILKEGKLKGMFNGFGGKVEDGETVERAAERELFEECGIKPLDLKKRGVLEYIMEEEGNPFLTSPHMEVHVFSVTRFTGRPVQTDEMRPEWFLHEAVPFDKMWPDDQYWIPLLLAGKNFAGTFHLKNPKEISQYSLAEV